ncbi:mechanosensitive ion channel protein MscS [Endozoicomonas sp. OPT23]|uniref:mechanosensitive ion channel family protein n=1 Tax=Endozoicomonas sp. OPT23 TaxID=2072845 RepID=UPI00129A4E04|nr:mechanosensitive ion channel family protein [Endozoicomonas sp. OPT23]MRI34190.1 mechanosensitive ion channel protein MscS [Endozoicomonas sp. OPT23]
MDEITTYLFGADLPSGIGQLLIVFGMAVACHLFMSRFFSVLTIQAEKTRVLWDDALIKSARKPVISLVWLIAFGWSIDIIHLETQLEVLKGIRKLSDISFVYIAGWCLYRFIRRLEKSYLNQDAASVKKDPTAVVAVGRLFRTIIVIIAFLISLQVLGYSISGILAFGGVGGLAIGFAAKDMLANFFGGLMVYLDKPFKVGDWIRSPDKNIEGTVEYIGWRQTRIRTFDKRPLYVPNATFTSISVENPSRMENRRIKEAIGLRYQDGRQVHAILAEIKSYLQQNTDIASDKTLMVNFDRFGASSLDCFIYCFTRTTDWVEFHRIKQEVLLEVMNIIHKHNADIAFPTRTIDPSPFITSLASQIEPA